MKEKDFEDIGKRLYDLEADPPKAGWKKIGTALNAPGRGSNKSGCASMDGNRCW
jgi:hypothetical protein